MFISINIFNNISTEDNTQSSNNNNNNCNNINNIDSNDMNTQVLNIFKPPPQFSSVINELMNMIGSDDFLFKAWLNRLKIQTLTPDYYRKTINFLQEKYTISHIPTTRGKSF